MAESETPQGAQPQPDAGESNAEQPGGPQAAQPSGERSGAQGGGAGRQTGGEGKSQQTLPPPTFESIVSVFSTQAFVALGLLPNPASGKTEKQLPVAKQLIDMLDVLEQKTQGNLTETERRQLQQTLTYLRLAFVEASKEANESAASK